MPSSNDTPPENVLKTIIRKLFIWEVPTYGNSIFYSLGFLALTCLAILGITGVVMVFLGSSWWLANPTGIFFRSIHLWAAQALILIVILHGLVVFSTSGFKLNRKMTWVFGVLAFILLALEAEFGYDLRGDFSSQYRALQGADFYNGAYLGKFINTLNEAQVFGIHVIIIPIIIVILIAFHYLFVKIRGIAKPYRSDISVATVPADHNRLFVRGGVLIALIILLAIIFPSPLVTQTTIGEVARQDPGLMAQTLLSEFNHTSDTATYLDSIDPYTYDTRTIYITVPYKKLIATTGMPDELAIFSAESSTLQNQDIAQAEIYFQNGGTQNALTTAISSLVTMAKSDLYEAELNNENLHSNPTYSLRFLSDTGVLDTEASSLHIATDQLGMLYEEGRAIPPGAWWLAPLGLLNKTILANDPDGDRDGAEILGLLSLLLVLFPFIPYLNRLPEKLHFAEWIWKAK